MFFTKSGSDYSSELWNINDLSSPATRVAIVRSWDANQRRTNEVVAGRSTMQHIVDWTPLLSSYNNNRYCPKQYIESDEINKNFLIEIIITFNNDHGTLISILFDSSSCVKLRERTKKHLLVSWLLELYQDLIWKKMNLLKLKVKYL